MTLPCLLWHTHTHLHIHTYQYHADGSLYIATPIDPLFILLPALEKASASGGMFCDMETILQQFLPCDDARMLYQIQHMVPSDQLACICDTKESGGQLYVRLNSDKVVTWLLAKLRKTREALCSVNSAFSSMDQHSLNAYALGIVSEYVSEAWSSALSDKCLPPSPAVNDDPNAGYATHLHDDLQHYNGEPNNHNNSSKKARMMDAKEVAKAKAEASRAATKAAKLEKASAGMRKLSSFFSKK